MSFSRNTRNNLARKFPEKRCCAFAEFCGLLLADGQIRHNSFFFKGFSFQVDIPALARKVYLLAKTIFQVQPRVEVLDKVRPQKGKRYRVAFDLSFPETRAQELQDFLAGEPGAKIISWRYCCRRAYLRGVFLGGGSVSYPFRGYHLELAVKGDFQAEIAALIMENFGLEPRLSRRKEYLVVYLKESEQIIAFLNIIGAYPALLQYENTRLLKDMKNRVNRLVNCETANLSKTVNAALRQLEGISTIESSAGLNSLPSDLQEVARLRLQYPEVSLKELGEMMTPSAGKSAVNHRMRRLEKIAWKLKRNKTEFFAN